MSELVPCSACSRHIRSTETACPFCRASAEPVAAQASPAPRGSMRLSRAALALAGMTALTACGKEVETRSLYGAPPTNNTSPPAPAYGGPPMMFDAEAPPVTPLAVDAGTDAAKEAGKPPAPKPAPNLVSPPAPAYGGPPPKH